MKLTKRKYKHVSSKIDDIEMDFRNAYSKSMNEVLSRNLQASKDRQRMSSTTREFIGISEIVDNIFLSLK